MSGAHLVRVGMDVAVKFGDSSSSGSQDIQQRNHRMRHFFKPFLNFDDCQPEVVSDVISGIVNQDVGVDACANFGDSILKPSEASISAPFRTSITSDRKYIVRSYPVWFCRTDGFGGSCKIW